MLKIGLLLSVLLSCAACRSRLTSSARLELLSRTQTYAQGIQIVECELQNAGKGALVLSDWETRYPSLNVAVCVGRDRFDYTVLRDAIPYNPNSGTNLVLDAGATLKINAESVFDIIPGEYVMFVILQNNPSVRSNSKRITVIKGQVTMPEK